ncbi:hypothetical protein [Terrisporobacter sp.]|uniref:hypothetical protein n=1 Tax=Terrisporobacter sp. TaxID=1965305 RepID=UPI002A7F5BBD|nr:hypothetical protein [Terrisporobacter sp.]MDY4734951.1 hypothetical protein [Terrisporobacter sp.]
MEKYYITLNNEELICLKQALLIARLRFNDKAEHACKLKNSIMEEIYKKEAIKTEKLLDELNNLK